VSQNKNSDKPSVWGSVLFVFLWLACVASAMGVVYNAFVSRKATQELEELRRESNSLQVESGQYQLEKSTLAAYSRIEKIAVEDLGMSVPSTDKTVLVYKQ